MTFAPGKNVISTLTNDFWQRNIDLDLKQLKDSYQIDILITVMEDWELKEFGISNLKVIITILRLLLKEKCKEYEIQNIQFSVKDGNIPTDLIAYNQLIKQINSNCLEGKNVIIHCRGGLGRTGTVAACCMIEQLKCPAQDAIDLVRKYRNGAIENANQENFVKDFEKNLKQLSI